MKTIRKFWFVLIVPMFVLSSCDLISEALTTKTTIDAPDVEFIVTKLETVKSKVKGSTQEVIELYRGEMNLDIAAKIKESLGIELDVLKGISFEDGSVEVIAPEDFDVNELAELKLYFNDTDNLVAEVDSVDADTKMVHLKVVNGDLLDKLNGGETLTVIITNATRLTPQSVTLKFASSYEITVGI